MKLDQHTALLTLGKLPLCQGLGQEELAIVLSLCKAVAFIPGGLIFREADTSNDLYILLSGQVDISVKALGVVHVVEAGSLFGEIGLVTRRHRTASAIARDHSQLLRIDYSDLEMLGVRRPHISNILMRNICATLADHLVRMNEYYSLEHFPNHGISERDARFSRDLPG